MTRMLWAIPKNLVYVFLAVIVVPGGLVYVLHWLALIRRPCVRETLLFRTLESPAFDGLNSIAYNGRDGQVFRTGENTSRGAARLQNVSTTGVDSGRPLRT